ncbi:MAG TPA: 3,4-dihydroxy-2-butanone-4-phosphate synthase [Steroidobacteraceae bacterium]|nr:3,4-dihydroxy-2-butanone-4-phosphate synthase [Steroidobacteraceae bacterium]
MSNILTLPPRTGAEPPEAAEAATGHAEFSDIPAILAQLRAGRMVLILDDEDRENEGDLIMAAEHATPASMAFMIRHSSGIICVPMEEERLLRLELPQMVGANNDSYRTAFTVSVDYRHGTSTGVSAADRAATITALADPNTAPTDFARPGHIFPLRPRRGGVLVRAGHTEAAVDLCVLAGLRPAGVLCELMNEDGSMARRAQCEAFARRHNLAIGTIADLIRYRLRTERSVDRIADQPVQTEFGEFRLCAYEDRGSHAVHLALVRGRMDGPEAPLVRVHVADTLRDALGLSGDGRSWTLRSALQRVAAAPNGVVVVLREAEPAWDVAAALQALQRPPAGAAAPAGESAAKPNLNAQAMVLRTFGVGAQILKDLGVSRMRVMSQPKQMHGLSAFGLTVESYVGADA